MRTISNETETVAPTPKKDTNQKSYSATLSDGRNIVIREMLGRDLVHMEKDQSKAGDVEKGLKLIERLVIGDDKITYEEIINLGVRDIKKLNALVADASGADDEDPN